MYKTYEESLNKILKALGNLTRVKIILSLYNLKESSFTDLMSELNMSTKEDSGKFAHHLKLLIDAGIVKEKERKGKYELTEFGNEIASLLQNLEESMVKEHKKILVRTSNLTMEPFEKRKIVEAIIREAGAPKTVAQQIAEEAEERILKSNIKYLTAPLIREIVNSILLEKGFEEYRHSMTRLGLPVYDVKKIINDVNQMLNSPLVLYFKSGSAVISEYMLIKELPREISDAHISGLINLNNLSYWGMMPENIHYNSSWILGYELSFENLENFMPKIKICENLDEVLERIIKIIYIMRSYISVGQVIDDINIILAKFVKNMKYEEILKKIEHALVYLNQMPDFMGKPQPLAIGLRIDKKLEEEFFEEKRLLFRAFIDVLLNGEDGRRPLLSPLPIIKLDSYVFNNAEFENEINKVCELILKWGLPFIVNLDWGNNDIASYCWDFTRVEKVEPMRFNNNVVGTVLINLPRIALEAKGNDEKFFLKLNESVELSVKALEKAREGIVEKSKKRSLPFSDSSSEFLGNIGLVGLYEALKIHRGEYINESKNALDFSKKVLDEIIEILKEKKYIRITEVSVEDAGRRFLISDSIRYGFKTIESKIGKKIERYTCNAIIPYEEERVSLNRRIDIESIFHKKMLGGHYFKINIEEPALSMNELCEYLNTLISEKKLAAFTFTRDFTYCRHCALFMHGKRERCDTCGRSISNLMYYSKRLNVYVVEKMFNF